MNLIELSQVGDWDGGVGVSGKVTHPDVDDCGYTGGLRNQEDTGSFIISEHLRSC